MSVFDQVNKFFGLQSGDGRKARHDQAVQDALKGKKANKPTLGNPKGKKEKK